MSGVDLRAEIESRIHALQAEREKFVAEAQARLGAYDGAIGELQRLLELANSGVETPTSHQEALGAAQDNKTDSGE